MTDARPRPTPPLPKPSATRLAPVAPAAARPQVAGLDEARAFGRVDAERRVFVRTGEGDAEREVGQLPEATDDEALTYFAEKYVEFDGQVALLETRLAAGTGKADPAPAEALLAELDEAKVVGDLPALRARLERVVADAAAQKEAQRAAADEAKGAAREHAETLVAEAEKLAGQDPARTQWKESGTRISELFDALKNLGTTHARLPRGEETALWARFKAARSAFDKNRRDFYGRLDKDHAEAKRRKQALIERAEALSTSTDWAQTAAAYRDLMTEWKAAGRARRAEDDKLWARFKGAQDAFFDARQALNAELDKEFEANLVVKRELLVEAEALLPVRDLGAAKSALRGIQERWEEAGKVPRGAMQEVEGRLRAVERALGDAEQNEWRRTDPTKNARADGALAQLDEQIARLEAAVGDAATPAKKAAAEEELAAKRQWRDMVAQVKADFS